MRYRLARARPTFKRRLPGEPGPSDGPSPTPSGGLALKGGENRRSGPQGELLPASASPGGDIPVLLLDTVSTILQEGEPDRDLPLSGLPWSEWRGPIQGPVLDGFAHMERPNLAGLGQIRHGPGHLEDAVVGPCGEAEPFHGPL